MAGCGPEPPAIPLVHGDVRSLEGVRFGLRPSELEEVRKDVALEEDGFYRESRGALDLSYGFLPWMEGRPPTGRARLEGLEIRKEVRDSTDLWRLWAEAVGAVARESVPGVCSETTLFRYRARRAVFADSVHVTLLAEVHDDPDGRGYEAFLTTRLETEAMVRAGPEWSPGDVARARMDPGGRPSLDKSGGDESAGAIERNGHPG